AAPLRSLRIARRQAISRRRPLLGRRLDDDHRAAHPETHRYRHQRPAPGRIRRPLHRATRLQARVRCADRRLQGCGVRRQDARKDCQRGSPIIRGEIGERTMKLYAHPFSSYCQKVLIALYENATPFELRMLAPGDAAATAEHAALWPLKRMPVLVDEGRTVVESSIIIEHLGLYHPGRVRLIPEESRAALDVRMMDRFFDNYIMTPMQKIVVDSLRSAEQRDRQGVAQARDGLDTAYRWLEIRLAGREWAAGNGFSL